MFGEKSLFLLILLILFLAGIAGALLEYAKTSDTLDHKPLEQDLVE